MARDDDEDAPTKVRQTRKQFALGATVQDLRQVLDRLAPVDEETTTSTPKMHDLGAMIKEVQEERLRELRSRHRNVTLRSVPRVDGVEDDDAGPETGPHARGSSNARLAGGGGGAPWPWMVAALGFGGVLVWLGTMIGRPLPAPPPDHVHLTWDVSAKDASVKIDGQAQPSRGSRKFPCTAVVELVVDRPGQPSESYNIPCGGELMVRLEQTSAP